jgi:hypothetical protein
MRRHHNPGEDPTPEMNSPKPKATKTPKPKPEPKPAKKATKKKASKGT